MILIISLCMAFLYVPAKMKRAPFTLSGDTDACFARSETVCDTHAVSKFFFGTSPTRTPSWPGPPPPALREIGPFVMHKGKEKKSNVTFHGAREDRVSYVATSYAEWDESSFCEGCSLDDVVVSFNPAYYTLVQTFGSETNFLYSLTPRVVPPRGRHRRRFSRARRGPDDRRGDATRRRRRRRSHRRVLRALALAQWGDCSPLGGASITTLALPGGDPRAVPRRARVRGVRGRRRGRRDGRLRRGGVWRRVGVDVHAFCDVDTGVAVLGLLQTPDAVLAASLGVSAVHALFVKGYVVHVAGSYGRAAGADAMGPFLGLVVLRVVCGANRPRVDPGLRRSAHVVARRTVGSEAFSPRR